jgi:hypothetical protein
MRTLADLHHRLHALPAPPGLDQPFGPGSALLHADLHPGQRAAGARRTRGHRLDQRVRWTGGADVATAWLLMACAGLPKAGGARSAQRLVRRIMVDSFLTAADGYGEHDLARRALATGAGRAADRPPHGAGELARMQKVIDREGLS